MMFDNDEEIIAFWGGLALFALIMWSINNGWV